MLLGSTQQQLQAHVPHIIEVLKQCYTEYYPIIDAAQEYENTPLSEILKDIDLHYSIVIRVDLHDSYIYPEKMSQQLIGEFFGISLFKTTAVYPLTIKQYATFLNLIARRLLQYDLFFISQINLARDLTKIPPSIARRWTAVTGKTARALQQAYNNNITPKHLQIPTLFVIDPIYAGMGGVADTLLEL